MNGDEDSFPELSTMIPICCTLFRDKARISDPPW